MKNRTLEDQFEMIADLRSKKKTVWLNPYLWRESIREWGWTDGLLMLLLGIGTIFTRWPFQATMLNNFDAVNYALALEHFDMRLAQPQAPGYPLYILIGRAFYLVLRDQRAALVWLSTIFSGLAVLAIYLAGRDMLGRRAGFIAALLSSSSTVVWYMGEVAAPYTADLFSSAVVGWLCYRMLNTQKSALLWVSALALGLAGALRLQTLVFLFPLFLYAAHKYPLKNVLASAALAIAVFSAFFISAIMLSGGPVMFLKLMVGILPVFRSTDTLVRSTRWVRFLANIWNICSYTLRTVGELAFPFVLIGVLSLGASLRFWRNKRLSFLLAWLLPSWFVFLVIWPGNLGTALVSAPPLFLLAAEGLKWVLRRGAPGRILGSVFTVGVVTWAAIAFIVLPAAPFGHMYRQFENYASLSERIQYYRSKLSLIGELPQEGTIIYADDFRHLQYYLPQYQVFSYPQLSPDNPGMTMLIVSIDEGKMTSWKNVDTSSLVPDGTRRIVFFDHSKDLNLDNQFEVKDLSGEGYSILVIQLKPGQQAVWTAGGLALKLPGG